MYAIEHSRVASWRDRHGWQVPVAIDVGCPHCGRLVTFTPGVWHDDSNTHTISLHSTCPACHLEVDFWFVHPVKEDGDLSDVTIAMHPSPRARSRFDDVSSFGSDGLQREYHNLIASYDAGIWDSAAIFCRRLLEGIVHDKVADERKRKPLHRGLIALKETADLAAPLEDLSQALRKGGNLGAHFGGDVSTDEETARLMLDLAEYLLEYFYLLPKRIRELDARLQSKVLKDAATGEQ